MRVAEKSLASIPSGRIGARKQRAFLGRAVKYLAGEAGIRQFLDFGTGLPTTENVHDHLANLIANGKSTQVASLLRNINRRQSI